MNFTNFDFFKKDNNIDLIDKFKKNFFNSNLSNSTIIYGEKGIGKSIFVKFFVNSIFLELNDKNKKNHNTNLIINNSHPNIKTVSLLYDEKIKRYKNNITIDQIRELQNFIYQSSINKLPKFIIIDSSDELNLNSSNALLKILEEPKLDTYFFLISHQLSKLTDTIKSRCIKFNFKKPTFNEFKDILLLNIEHSLSDDEIEYFFHLSNGSPGIAKNLYLHDTNEMFNKLLDIFKEKKVLSNNIIQLSNELHKYENNQFENFLILFKFIIINILKIKLGINISKRFSEKLLFEINELSKFLNTKSCFNLLNYLNTNENNLFKLNLDKKIFTINLLSEISNN
tara:strand:- start:1480 stop:2499 length:1020 start_codon:yes stop_codon:yes gene_type:complete